MIKNDSIQNKFYIKSKEKRNNDETFINYKLKIMISIQMFEIGQPNDIRSEFMKSL